MTEQEMRKRFEAERGMLEALGNLVINEVSYHLSSELKPHENVNAFLRMPPSCRVKDTNSFVAKALYRGMNFADPYNDILDKVGVRFVVLLREDTRTVGKAVKQSSLWSFAQSREFERERDLHPTLFDYQSDHYIVKLHSSLEHEGTTIAANTPCEIQVRTLMQHAYSEMSHDTVYKPAAVGAPPIRRALAKSMALLEAAEDVFQTSADIVNTMQSNVSRTIEQLNVLYREGVHKEPVQDVKTSVWLLSNLGVDPERLDVQEIKQFFDKKPALYTQIFDAYDENYVLRLGAVLYIYCYVASHRADYKEKWPLPINDVLPICRHLGISVDNG